MLNGDDQRLLDSPLGLAGHRALGLLWCAAGEPLIAARRAELLDVARTVSHAHPLRATVGCTSPHEQAVLVRVLAPRVEPIMQLFGAVWAAWRPLAWGLNSCAPRVWRT